MRPHLTFEEFEKIPLYKTACSKYEPDLHTKAVTFALLNLMQELEPDEIVPMFLTASTFRLYMYREDELPYVVDGLKIIMEGMQKFGIGRTTKKKTKKKKGK